MKSPMKMWANYPIQRPINSPPRQYEPSCLNGVPLQNYFKCVNQCQVFIHAPYDVPLKPTKTPSRAHLGSRGIPHHPNVMCKHLKIPHVW